MKGLWKWILAIIKLSLGNALAQSLSVCYTAPFCSERSPVIALSSLFSTGNEAVHMFPLLDSGQKEYTSICVAKRFCAVPNPTKKARGDLQRNVSWLVQACLCLLLISKSKEGSLAFYSCQSLLKSNNPASHREPGAQYSSLGGWERKIHAEHPTSEPRRGLLWEEISGLAALLLSCNLPVRWVDLLGFCSVALILIFDIFSRADVRAITCAQQICVWASKVSGEAWGFLIQENGELGTSISWVCIWESE